MDISVICVLNMKLFVLSDSFLFFLNELCLVLAQISLNASEYQVLVSVVAILIYKPLLDAMTFVGGS